jgi:hypothetical protein
MECSFCLASEITRRDRCTMEILELQDFRISNPRESSKSGALFSGTPSDRPGWVSRLVPSDYDEAAEIDFALDFELTVGEKSGSLATVLPDAQRRLLTSASPSCGMRRPLALHRSTKVWSSGSELQFRGLVQTEQI